MKTNISFTPKKGHNLRDKLGDLVHNQDFKDYLTEMADIELYIEIRPKAKLTEKQMMYNYYHKVILGVAIEAFTDLGWEDMDKMKADHILKAQCACGTMVKEGEEHIFLEDKSRMTKARLRKFLTDCILFLDKDLGYRVPESEPWKNKERFGNEFRTVSSIKPNENF